MNTSQKIGGAFLLTCVGCGLAVPELMKDGTVLSDWSSPTTWGAVLSFMGAFLGAVTGAMALFKNEREPLDRRQTEQAVGRALFDGGMATKADINALAERLLAERESGTAPPPIEQLKVALEGLAKSGAAAKTEAFELISQDRLDEGLAQLEAFAQRQSQALGEAADQTAQTWRQVGILLMTRNAGKAAEAFERAEAAAPGDRWTLVELCRLYTGTLGRPSAAAQLLPRLRDAIADDDERLLALETEGDVLQAQGRLPEALERYNECLTLCRALASADPRNSERRRTLSVALNKTGDVLKGHGRLAEALERFDESLALCRKLSEDDPGHAERLRDLSVALNKTGDVLRAQRRLPEALQSYEEGLALRRALIKDDPGHAERRRDLSVALNKTGDVLRAQGLLAEALERYDESLVLRRTLIKDDPSHAERRRDLSVALSKTGDVLRMQGRLAEALERQDESLDLCRSLAADDPSYVERQRDLSVALESSGDVLDLMGRVDQALARYRESLPIAEALAAALPAHVGFQEDLEITRKRIAKLEENLV